MKNKLLIKFFRYYLIFEKKFKGKFSLIETLALIILVATITMKIMQQIEEKPKPSVIIYDYVKPSVPLESHDRIRLIENQ